jgi:hypothetical protein
MARRTTYDSLQPVDRPMWLVTKDMLRTVQQVAELAPGTDLRVVLTAARNARVAAGWACDDISRSCGFFFAERGGERVQVGIEVLDPAQPIPAVPYRRPT